MKRSFDPVWGLIVILGIAVLGLTIGGVWAAVQGEGLSDQGVAMTSTVIGALVGAVAGVTVPRSAGGTDAIPEPATTPGPQADPGLPAVSPDDAGGAMAVPVVADPVTVPVTYASGDESYGGTGTITEDVTAEFLGDDSDA